MTGKILVDRILYSKKAKWRKFKWLQNGNLKELSDERTTQLIASMNQQDFVAPFYVWLEKPTGITWILDGCHREKILHLAESKEVFTAPDELTAIYIDCKSKKEAAELVLIYSSVYAQTTRQGLEDFAAENAIDMTAIEAIAPIPFVEVFLLDNEEETEKEVKEDGFEDSKTAEHTQAITVSGDIYEIRSEGLVHRLICGDSRSVELVSRLMNGQKAFLSFTSPPYNVGENPRMIQQGRESFYEGFSDNKDKDEYLHFLIDYTNNTLKFSEYSFNNIQMVAGNKLALIEYQHHFRKQFVDVMVWDKGSTQPAMAEYVLNSRFEFIFIFKENLLPSRSIRGKYFRGTIPNVYNGPQQFGNKFHKINAATFPVHLPAHIFESFVERGSVVLDLFMGTGTSIIAADQIGVHCYGSELSPFSCDITIARYLKYKREELHSFEVCKNGKLLGLEELDEYIENVFT